MSRLLQPNTNDSLTMKAVDTDNSVDPTPNLMSISDRTPTTHQHVSNSTLMLPKPPNIPHILYHTKPSRLLNVSISNAKYCDKADPIKPSSPTIPIFP